MTNSTVAVSSSPWWTVLLRGLLAIALGILLLANPEFAIGFLAFILGFFAVIDGVLMIVVALGERREYSRWVLLLIQGLLAVIIGIVVLFSPVVAAGVASVLLLWLFVIYGVILGLASIVASTERSGSGRTWGIIGGVLTLLFGIVLAVFLVLNPVGVVELGVWIIAIWALISGLLLVIASFRVKSGKIPAF
jgi:uncharacterized membrane protein HdeD (DUF308 family)